MPRAPLKSLACAAAVFALAAASAHAAAPEPRQPVEISKFVGRWHEVLRTPNKRQNACVRAFQDWSAAGGAIHVEQHCVHANGKDARVGTRVKSLNNAGTKYEASFFGGIIKKRYWVLDHDPGYSWMIASTDDGKFVSALTRAESVSPEERTAMKERVAALGLNPLQLQTVGK